MNTPIVRVSKGHFSAENYSKVRKLIDDSAKVLVPALENLRGLLYYHAAVDEATSTVMNVSVWEDLDAARQLDTVQAMLSQRPPLEAAGVTFERIANYEPLWKIEKAWRF